MSNITVQGVTVHFDRQPALWDVSFSLPEGALVAIIGPNGAGKSTLVKAMMGLIPMVSGTVHFQEEPLAAKRQSVAYVPQKETVDWDFPITVKEVVLMGSYGRLGFLRRPSRADKEEAHRMLERLGMADLANRPIHDLSGGQQQRVFVARALMQKPSIYLMDEPFAGIDKATEQLLIEIFLSLKAEGKTVMIVHHDLNSLKGTFDHLILLNRRLVAAGRIEDVFTKENLEQTFGNLPGLFDRLTEESHAL